MLSLLLRSTQWPCRFCRIVKLANYRRYIYYQEENSIDVSCVFIPVIAIFSVWEQNGSVIIQSKTVLAFMTYMVKGMLDELRDGPLEKL